MRGIYCIGCGAELNDSMSFCPICGNKIVFPPYNVEQLADILQKRSKLLFNGAIDNNVIPLCSAMAAKEESNVSYALDLLQTAGEIADGKCSDIISGGHVKEAKERIEYNMITDILRTLPTQQQRVLEALLKLAKAREEITSGKLYEAYTDLYKKDAVTYRRLFDFINELEMLGIISTNTISRGWGKGRTNIINLQCDLDVLERYLYSLDIVNTNSEEPKLSWYKTVDFIDFYETRAVRHSSGGSYGKKGFRIYDGISTSTQEWTKLGSGDFTLGGNKSYFVGGGQQRTIDTKKIVNVTYFSDTSGIEVSVSNRQKSMRFMLPGRTIEDGRRLADAILSGEEQVALTEPIKDSGSCYIATYVYGNYDASEVLILRKFRDEKLLTNSIGTLFVKFYYKISPFLIKHFGGKIFKNTTQKFLDYIIKKLN